MRRTSLALAGAGALLVVTTPLVWADHERNCFGEHPTIVGTIEPETIEGTSGRDVIVALGGGDQIRGGDGADLICASAGNDGVGGGAGADRISGGRGQDTLGGGPGHDYVHGGTGVNQLSGGPGDDRLLDGAYMAGGPGEDYMRGGEYLYPHLSPMIDYRSSTNGIVADLETGVVEGQGTDTFADVGTIFGSAYDDTMRGWEEGDLGNGHEIYLYGLGGNDRITGIAVDPFYGVGVASGGNGSDHIEWRGGEVDGGSGPDRLYGGSLSGGPGPDRLFGTGRLFGEEGNDYINSQDGSVTATVDGGSNLDTCLTDPGESVVNCESVDGEQAREARGLALHGTGAIVFPMQ